jgi:tetratricopeptide (TPR) repeat protein
MTIYGLGGCGKSALALEFAYRALVRHARHMVFWVPAISQESFDFAYREIGVRLGVPGITEDNADIKKLVKTALGSGSFGDWLMIVDNADDPGVLLGSTDNDAMSTRLSDCLPHSSNGTILFTTRSRKVAGDLTPSSVLELNDMSKAEARQLLARRLAKQALLDDATAVKELLAILTYLPLAIVQAAAFINNNDISVSGYISLFRHTGTESELFSESFEDPSRYREMDSTVAKTWHISFDQIQRQDQLAAEYLSFMACIDRIDIPQSLLPRGGSLVQQVKALGTLAGYAFITERQQTAQELGGERFFDMHRLVHMASAWWLEGHNERAIWVGKAVARLEELVPHGGHGRKEIWTPYLSHAVYVAGLSDTIEETARASLLDRIGRCQASLGQFLAAENTHRQVLSLLEKILGKEHSLTLVSMSGVGLALLHQGRYEEAKSTIKQTLERREKALGVEHPDTLGSMSNLAIVLDKQGKHEEAESMNRQTLALREKVLGREHPSTLGSMSNLAVVLDMQSRYEEAESMIKQTLERQVKVLGREHISTLGSMSNLALVLDKQGKHEEAESINRQTLVRQETLLGPEHPDTLDSMSNLAVVLDKQGKHEEAESMNRQTLTLKETVLGREHPDTLMSVYRLAQLLANRYHNDESLGLYERACAAFPTVLGNDHPTTRACRQHYSEALASQKQDRSCN